jgi:LacI family transcriptional regulator, galactose operon repressor
MATMSDVARTAGVSVATVSRVLSNGGAGVSPALRERVSAAVAELDYHPNHLPRNLRARSSRTIGLVISDIDNPFFTAIARGAEDVAHRRGYTMVLSNTDEDAGREEIALQTMAAERAAGVIVASTGQHSDGVRRLISTGIPVVALDRRIIGAHVDTVVVDNETAAYEAVSHLASLGHRRVAMVGGPGKVSPILEREAGYDRAVRDHGLETGLLRHGDLREAAGRRTTLELLYESPRPTAIFSVNNMSTIGVLHALRDLRLRAPEDVSVIGFDDIPTGDLLDPPISVVRQPTYQLGARAADLLLRRVAEPGAPVQEVVLAASLVLRPSTGPQPNRND